MWVIQLEVYILNSKCAKYFKLINYSVEKSLRNNKCSPLGIY